MKLRALILFLAITAILLSVNISFEVKAQENVAVLSSTIYQTWGSAPFSLDKGDYLVAGEVENFGSTPQKFNLTAIFYDSSGAILGTSYLSDSLPDAPACYLHVLLPNQKSPFLLWFSRFDQQGIFRIVDHYELVLTTSLAGSYHPGLVIVLSSSHEAGGSLFIEGSIQNVGSATTDGLSVYVTYYNTNGDVLAVSAEGTSGLAPNEIAPFMVPLNGFNEGGRLEAIDRYEVVAESYENSLWNGEGQLIRPEVVYTLGTPEPTVVPVQPENSDYVFILVLVIVVFVIIAVAVTLMRSKKAKPKNPD
jgi:hypothetical protein